jgi:hypothetical protein
MSYNCKFVGYPKEYVGYYFYHFVGQKMFVSKYASFLEKEFILEMSSGRKIKLNKVKNHKLTSKWN